MSYFMLNGYWLIKVRIKERRLSLILAAFLWKSIDRKNKRFGGREDNNEFGG